MIRVRLCVALVSCKPFAKWIDLCECKEQCIGVASVCNVDEASVQNGNHFVDAVRAAVKDEGAEVLVIGAKIEADITELETYDERQMFLDELDLDELREAECSSVYDPFRIFYVY